MDRGFMNKFYVVLTSLILISGCSSTENDCEEFKVKKSDVKVCFDLQKKIATIKQNTEERTTLETKFINQCVIESTKNAKEKVCSLSTSK